MELQGNLGGGFLLRNIYYNQITTSSTTDFGYQILCLKVKRGKKRLTFQFLQEISTGARGVVSPRSADARPSGPLDTSRNFWCTSGGGDIFFKAYIRISSLHSVTNPGNPNLIWRFTIFPAKLSLSIDLRWKRKFGFFLCTISYGGI